MGNWSGNNWNGEISVKRINSLEHANVYSWAGQSEAEDGTKTHPEGRQPQPLQAAGWICCSVFVLALASHASTIQRLQPMIAIPAVAIPGRAAYDISANFSPYPERHLIREGNVTDRRREGGRGG